MLDGDVYEYLGLPMGLTCSPRIFTKISKAVVDVLRKRGIIVIVYIDVSFINIVSILIYMFRIS